GHPGWKPGRPPRTDRMETIFAYGPGSPVVLEPQDEDAGRERLDQIKDYYDARVQAQSQPGSGAPYRPLPPDRLYLTDDAWRKHIDDVPVARLSPFALPEQQGALVDIGAKQGRNFAAERTEPGRNVFEAVTEHVLALQAAKKRVIVALWSDGSRDRMQHVLSDHRLANLTPVASWPQAMALPKPQVALAVLGLETGFETADVAVISGQDILGERLVRPRRAARRPEKFIAEVTSLSARDLVLHGDHGLRPFVGPPARRAPGPPHHFP